MCQLSHKFFFNWLPQKQKLLKPTVSTVTSASGTDLGPIGQHYLTFWLRNKYFMDKCIILWDLCGDLVLGLHWKLNYIIGFNWNTNGHQPMTHNNNYLCTSILLEVTKPNFQNAGTFYLQPRWVSMTTVQEWTELKSQHIFQLNIRWTDIISGWPQGQPQVPQVIQHNCTQYIMQQVLHPKITYIGYNETPSYRECRGQWDFWDQTQETEQKGHW